VSDFQVNALHKRFGGLVAVNSVQFEVNAGEILALIGPNGAGKSTIFNLVTGFLRADAGTVTFMGENLLGLRPDQIARRGIGRTFQSPLMFRDRTVLENLVAGYTRVEKAGFWPALLNRRSYQDEERKAWEKALETLDLLDLSVWKDTLVGALPCGLLRFMAIGQAIMSPVRLLLLDEPLTGLNDEEMVKMLGTLNELRERGVTIFMIEHHMKAIMKFCERIIVINFGTKIAEGPPSEIKENKAVIEAYLGSKRGKQSAS
jgi:branched-chain amino acid transport system ATP-binding protein